MLISEFINKLNQIKAIHGDLLCITPGMDESDYTLIKICRIINVVEDPDCSNYYVDPNDYSKKEFTSKDFIKAVDINFA